MKKYIKYICFAAASFCEGFRAFFRRPSHAGLDRAGQIFHVKLEDELKKRKQQAYEKIH